MNWLKLNTMNGFPLPYDNGRGEWMPFEYNGEILLCIEAKESLIENNIPFEEVERSITIE